MKVTKHAAVRLLQRAFGMNMFKYHQILNTRKLIEKDIANICARNNSFTLPSFSNLKAIVVQNHVVTIVDKKSMYLDKKKSLQLLCNYSLNHSKGVNYEYRHNKK